MQLLSLHQYVDALNINNQMKYAKGRKFTYWLRSFNSTVPGVLFIYFILFLSFISIFFFFVISAESPFKVEALLIPNFQAFYYFIFGRLHNNNKNSLRLSDFAAILIQRTGEKNNSEQNFEPQKLHKSKWNSRIIWQIIIIIDKLVTRIFKKAKQTI